MPSLLVRNIFVFFFHLLIYISPLWHWAVCWNVSCTEVHSVVGRNGRVGRVSRFSFSFNPLECFAPFCRPCFLFLCVGLRKAVGLEVFHLATSDTYIHQQQTLVTVDGATSKQVVQTSICGSVLEG